MAVNQLATFIPTAWSTALNRALRKNLVLANIVNRNHQGEVRPGGTVRVNRPGPISVTPYDPTATTITYATPTATTMEIAIDNREHFAFQIDDLDADLSNMNLVEMYSDEAAHALADAIDQSIAAEYANAGLDGFDLDLTVAEPASYYSALVQAGAQLDVANVPRQGRWHVTSALGYAQLLEDSKFTQASALGDQTVQSGAVGTAAGFTIFTSNNLELVEDAGTFTRQTLFGTNRALSHVRALTGAPEALRLESKFAVGIRGELAWGNKVFEPNALGVGRLVEQS